MLFEILKLKNQGNISSLYFFKYHSELFFTDNLNFMTHNKKDEYYIIICHEKFQIIRKKIKFVIYIKNKP